MSFGRAHLCLYQCVSTQSKGEAIGSILKRLFFCCASRYIFKTWCKDVGLLQACEITMRIESHYVETIFNSGCSQLSRSNLFPTSFKKNWIEEPISVCSWTRKPDGMGTLSLYPVFLGKKSVILSLYHIHVAMIFAHVLQECAKAAPWRKAANIGEGFPISFFAKLTRY